MFRRFALPSVVAAALCAGAASAANVPHLLPMPSSIKEYGCGGADLPLPRIVGAQFDAGALALIDERWTALGIPPLRRGGDPDVVVTHARLAPQSYVLSITPRKHGSVSIVAGDGDGAFYAAMTLAQLPRRRDGRWGLPCTEAFDVPALRWRILSDDVSRGPLPTMRYFEERIRTIAAFKMNGYSPYMEHVFADPRVPLPAPLDGITPQQLRHLATYARRFHVAFIPEQQTFAHMHNTLRWEEYAPAAELPHGYLMSPSSALTYPYLQTLIDDETRAVPHPPFFHIGSDEPSDLGRGQTSAAVLAKGDAAVYAAHVTRMAAMIAPSGARPMIWDDAIQTHPNILQLIPKNVVIVNWHYGSEPSFEPYIRTIATGGFQQMVAPGANNWNEIFPDIATAIPNENRFITEGKAAHVLGLFQTVWHDDGESLYEATWYPVLYAACSAWESGPIDPTRFQRDFPAAFFGSGDSGYGADIAALGDAVHALKRAPEDTTDYLFWADPLDPLISARMQNVNLAAVRRSAETVMTHLSSAVPPLHANAARVMYLSARRLDALARDYQIGTESRAYYDDGSTGGQVRRGMFVAKYLFWEIRDEMELIATLYASAWNYESRPGHLPSVLERYHMAAQRAIVRADLIDRAMHEHAASRKAIPAFDDLFGLTTPVGEKPVP